MPKEVKDMLQVRPFEEKMNLHFNIVTSKMGMKETKWGAIALYMFLLWALLTCLVCFEKPDFLNVSFFLMSAAHSGICWTSNHD
jgi:hypothetical protein